MKKLGLVIGLGLLLMACTTMAPDELIVYTSVDQNISETILHDFEEATGIRVLPVYDIEASKTTGLANRLIAEKDNPQADVFWSSEIILTLKLKQEGVFEVYQSPSSAPIPPAYKDKEGYWTGFGGRARVMIINTQLMSEPYPSKIKDLISPQFAHVKKAIANPMFGTTLTHLYVMNQMWGMDETMAYFESLKDNNVMVVEGNAVVRDLVVAGQVAFGLTDTDDAFSAMRTNDHIKVLYLDQEGPGTLVIPNTIGLVKGAKNAQHAKTFIDYILKKETEEKLIQMGYIDVSLTDQDTPLRFLACDFEKALEESEDLVKNIQEMLVQ